MDKYTQSAMSVERAIKIKGGVKSLAQAVGVSYQTVLNWKNGRFLVSAINCQKIEQATDGQVKAEDILPHYPWNELR